MQQVKNPQAPIKERAAKIRKFFKAANPEVKSKFHELIPFSKKSDSNSSIYDFSDWSQWSQWSQRQ